MQRDRRACQAGSRGRAPDEGVDFVVMGRAGRPKEILGFGAERGHIIQRRRSVRRACAALLIMLATRAPLLPCIRHQQEQTANG